ncbi:MAG: hypothetical protein OXC67_08875 [Flavobacteriaceae bacterium]|nr:hypothetical protein [Flavobacteriaceae bacterium]
MNLLACSFSVTTEPTPTAPLITITATQGKIVSIEVILEKRFELQQWQSDCGTWDASEKWIDVVVTQDCSISTLVGMASPLYLDANGISIRNHPWGKALIGQRMPLRRDDGSITEILMVDPVDASRVCESRKLGCFRTHQYHFYGQPTEFISWGIGFQWGHCFMGCPWGDHHG